MTDIRDVIIEVRPLLYTYLTDTKDDGPWVTCLQKLETRAIEMAQALMNVPAAVLAAKSSEHEALKHLLAQHCADPDTVATISAAIDERARTETKREATGWAALAEELSKVFPTASEKDRSQFTPLTLDEIRRGETSATESLIAALRRVTGDAGSSATNGDTTPKT